METGTEVTPKTKVVAFPSSLVGFGIRLGIGVTILTVLLWFLDLSRIFQAFAASQPAYLIAGTAFLFLNIGSQILKWQYLLRSSGRDISVREATLSVLFGNSLGSITPGHLGEPVGRALRINGGDTLDVTGLAVLDRFQNLLIMGIGMAIALPAFMPIGVGAGIVVAIGVSAAILLLAVRLSDILKFVGRMNWRIVHTTLVTRAIASSQSMTQRQLLISLGYSTLLYFVMFFQMTLFLAAFGSISLWNAFFGFAATMFTKSVLPVSFADLGIREVSSVYFFTQLGVSDVAGFNAAILMFAVNILLPALAGVFFVPRVRMFFSRGQKP